MILLKFMVDGVMYFVSKEGKKIRYSSIVDGVKKTDLSQDEIDLINGVIQELIPSRERVRLTDYTLNGARYQVEVDLRNGFRFFSPLPKFRDLVILNKLFNEMNECVFLEGIPEDETSNNKNCRDENKKVGFVKRIVNVGRHMIIVSVSVVTILSLGAMGFDIVYASNTKRNDSLTNDQIYNLVTKALETNQNLTSEEKDIFMCDSAVYVDNREYMDFSCIEKRLEGIKINYVNDGEATTLSGCYSPHKNEITFFGVDSIDDVLSSVASHEVCHALTEYKFGIGFLNDYLMETTNTIFNEEYSGDTEKSLYVDYYNYTKMLMEVIGGEPLKQYHNYTSLSPIIDSLCSIINSKPKAFKLLATLDNYKAVFDKYARTDDGEEKDEMRDNLERIHNDITTMLGEYYYEKYGISMYDDLVMLYYLDEDLFREKVAALVPQEYANGKLDINNKRVYFNTKKMNEINSIQVCVYSDDFIIQERYGYIQNEPVEFLQYVKTPLSWINITDENRYINQDDGLVKRK